MPDRSAADVIVIGAGVSGLTAARRIEHAGRRCVVLEARARVGGRTLTTTVAGATVDLGASAVTPAADRVLALAEELGIATEARPDVGRKLLDHGGRVEPFRGPLPRLPALVVGELGLTLGRIEAMARLVPPGRPMAARLGARWDETSVDEWLTTRVRHPETRAILAAAVQARFAAEPSELSFLSLLFSVHSSGGIGRLVSARGGPMLQFVDGAQALPQGLAARLRSEIRLSTPTTRIESDDAGVTVHAGGDEFRARWAILAIAPRAARSIVFDPPLTAARAELHARTPQGRVTTWALVYDAPFWREQSLSGESLSTADPVRTTFDATREGTGPGVLAARVVSDAAERLRQRPRAERRQAVLDHLVRIFGEGAATPLGDAEMDWSAEPEGGGYATFWPPGVLSRTGRAFRRPAGRLHFAGAETAKRGNGRLDGAVEAGERAADEVLELLRRDVRSAD
jgi:monoamine oxidase